MTTTLADVKVGDEILAIGTNPAATVTVGIPWGDVPQRLVVTAVSTHGKTVWMQFDNGGRLLPTDGKRACTIATR
jgi:hypothetical protein